MGSGLKLFKLGPKALFSEYQVTTSSGKSLESIDRPYLVSSMDLLKKSKFGKMTLLLVLNVIVVEEEKKYPLQLLILWLETIEEDFIIEWS